MGPLEGTWGLNYSTTSLVFGNNPRSENKKIIFGSFSHQMDPVALVVDSKSKSQPKPWVLRDVGCTDRARIEAAQ